MQCVAEDRHSADSNGYNLPHIAGIATMTSPLHTNRLWGQTRSMANRKSYRVQVPAIYCVPQWYAYTNVHTAERQVINVH